MATARQLTDQGRERKQQLLDAAAALFADRGYASTRVIDICEAAGVAKGLFYWYFENKEALFVELVRSMRLKLRKAQKAGVDPEADPLARLRQGAEVSVRFMAENMAFFALLELDRLGNDQALWAELREGSRVHAADSTARILEAQQAGQVPDDHDAGLLAIGVVGAIAQFSHAHRAGRITMSVDELATFAGQWVVQALAGIVPNGLAAAR